MPLLKAKTDSEADFSPNFWIFPIISQNPTRDTDQRMHGPRPPLQMLHSGIVKRIIVQLQQFRLTKTR